MTEYFDIACGDDVDAFARDVPPLDVLAQDIYHWLITNKMSLLRDPDWGFGLEMYLGKPISLLTMAAEIENGIRTTFSDRVSDASCVIRPIDGEQDAYTMTLKIEVDSGFLEIALEFSPTGIVRIS